MIVAYDSQGKRQIVQPYSYKTGSKQKMNATPFDKNGKQVSPIVWKQQGHTLVRTWEDMRNNPNSQYRFIWGRANLFSDEWYAWVSKDGKTLHCTVEKPDVSECLEGKISKNSVKGLGNTFRNITTVQSDKIVAATSMDYMFNGCSSLTNIDALSNWDTSKVTSMRSMFNGCPATRPEWYK